MKEVPTHALRAVFAGVGQLLLAADRIRKQAEDRASPAPAGPDSGSAAQRGTEPAAAAAPPAAAGQPQASPDQARWRSLDKTGNVRLLSAEDLAGDIPDSPVSPAAAAPLAEPAALAEPAPLAEPGTAADTADATRSGGDAVLPVPNYDALSLPSLRARLRALDTEQVRVLAEYERSHAGRADVVAMFERRIAKLAAEG